MDKRLCEKILQHFDFMTVETLNAYIKQRVESLHLRMESAGSMDEFKKLQGAIAEIKNLEYLRRDAAAIIERDRNG